MMQASISGVSPLGAVEQDEITKAFLGAHELADDGAHDRKRDRHLEPAEDHRKRGGKLNFP